MNTNNEKPAIPAGYKPQPSIADALAYSRNYATANPLLSNTAKEHILGLCNLLERAQTSQQGEAAAWMHKDGRVISSAEKYKMLSDEKGTFARIAERFDVPLYTHPHTTPAESLGRDAEGVEGLVGEVCDACEGKGLVPHPHSGDPQDATSCPGCDGKGAFGTTLPMPLRDLLDFTEHCLAAADEGADYAVPREWLEAMTTMGIMTKVGRGKWAPTRDAEAVARRLRPQVDEAMVLRHLKSIDNVIQYRLTPFDAWIDAITEARQFFAAALTEADSHGA